ncbi:MAG: hemerythrin domain-containing protein [Polyangiaceae bacterium]|nr:hemerythrin domain-containing protein [Myxococcales bacterium]MCB9587674.1 hemerythrin domain-containing protein [Polyangiaceae bacterium]MCB9605528.1 hemerythrin domain-containing protein [Polyangiaceae bacterium]
MPHTRSSLDYSKLPEHKFVGATSQPFVGIFKTLVAEHRDLASMIKRLAAAEDAKARAEIFPKLRDQLVAHEQGEMDLLYPLLRERGLTYGLAEQHDRSARKLEVIVGCLSGYSFSNPQWSETAQTLLEVFVQHVEEEEERVFALAQEALGGECAEQVGARYRELKGQVKEWQQGERKV